MYDIITIGSAMKDVFLLSNEIKTFKTKKAVSGEGVILNLGSKVEVDRIILETGGGGTNTAVGFSRLGLRTAFFGKTGSDSAGIHILDVLRKNKVGILALKDEKHTTGYSTIICAKNGERIALVYRGANNFIKANEVKTDKFKTKWIYFAPLSGESLKIIPRIIGYCKKKGIKVAMNPSSKYIDQGIIQKILKDIDILLLNREEASRLTKINYKNEKKIFKKLRGLTDGIIVMTEGEKGAMACDRNHVYKSTSQKIRVVSTLGAGDAFNSGFTTAIIKGLEVEYALKLGTLNALSVIRELGAKNGLLKIDYVKRHDTLMEKIKVSRLGYIQEKSR